MQEVTVKDGESCIVHRQVHRQNVWDVEHPHKHNMHAQRKAFEAQGLTGWLQDRLHGFPGLFNDTSERIVLLPSSFSLFHFLVFGSVL